MLAETRLGNNSSLIIAKCQRNGLLDGRDSNMSGSITENISFSFQVSVNIMCFLIIILVKRKDIWPFESKIYFPRLVQQLCSTISPIYDFQWINSCTLSSARLSAVLLLYVINSCTSAVLTVRKLATIKLQPVSSFQLILMLYATAVLWILRLVT